MVASRVTVMDDSSAQAPGSPARRRARWGAQERASDGPTYTGAGELIRPADYREWAFVTSGVGMTYGPAQPATGQPAFFDNVFVNRESYRAFTQTGRWPDKTMFLLEIRRGEVNVSINNGGQTQGEVVALESAVKDSARFPGDGLGLFHVRARPGRSPRPRRCRPPRPATTATGPTRPWRTRSCSSTRPCSRWRRRWER